MNTIRGRINYILSDGDSNHDLITLALAYVEETEDKEGFAYILGYVLRDISEYPGNIMLDQMGLSDSHRMGWEDGRAEKDG